MDILDESVQHQNDEFQEVRDQIREAELIEANKIHSLSRIKWLGFSDEPKKHFFTLLKAKQQRKLMSILLADDGESIVEDDAIL